MEQSALDTSIGKGIDHIGSHGLRHRDQRRSTAILLKRALEQRRYRYYILLSPSRDPVTMAHQPVCQLRSFPLKRS